jgi:sugar lactone lactonase YvrE
MGPVGVAIGPDGSVFIADTFNNRIRKVSPTGIISTVAGTGAEGYGGDGQPAVGAVLNHPHKVAVDAAGNLFITDTWNHCIRKVSTSGIISTVVGVPGAAGYQDATTATAAKLWYPTGIAIGNDGSLYIADAFNGCVRKMTPAGAVSTVAGRAGHRYYSGDGGLATAATLYGPWDVELGIDGSVLVADIDDSRVRAISASGIITTIAGTGVRGYNADGIPAKNAQVAAPAGLAVDAQGNIFVADSANSRIRRIDYASATITTVAGTGKQGFQDGIPAVKAGLKDPYDVAFDADGILHIADTNNNRIRKVVPCASLVPALAAPLSSTPFSQNADLLSACGYTTMISSSSQLPIWGQGAFAGAVTGAATSEQVYQLTSQVGGTSHYIGSLQQPIQNYTRFSFSFDFLIQSYGKPADAMFFMVGASQQPTTAYLYESDGLGLKVVLGCYEANSAMYNKVRQGSWHHAVLHVRCILQFLSEQVYVHGHACAFQNF